MMRSYTPSPAIVKTGLAKAPRATPTQPKLSRRGRWSPPMPQG